MNESGNGNVTICPTDDERTWWIVLVTCIVIYLIGLGASCIFYSLKLCERCSIAEKERSNRSNKRSTCFHKTRKDFHNFFRQLLLGDNIQSKVLISITLLCNIIYMILAVYRTYSPPSTSEECFRLRDRPERIVEMVVNVELILFAVVRFMASNNIILFWFSPYTLVDVFTLPHIFISEILGVDWIGLRSLRFLWLMQVLNIFHFYSFISHETLDIVTLLLSVLILWLTSTGILHMIEIQGDPWNYSNAQNRSILTYSYLIIVTASTVGYGDFFPKTALGQTFIVVFIILGVATFAAILPKLVEVLSTFYEKTQYRSFNTSRVPQHIIVCGHITSVTAEDFLIDFLHSDRGDNRTHILFLHPEKPDKALKTILQRYYTRVQYLNGSVLVKDDLEKAHIDTCQAIFILANKNTRNEFDEDRANLLRLTSVKNTNIKISVVVQVLHSHSKKIVLNVPGWDKNKDLALCLNEMKLGLLAQSCLCPGFSTLIANLFYTSDFPIHQLKRGRRNKETWREDYSVGASNEIYSSPFSSYFVGMSFHAAAEECYNTFQLVLLALECGGKLYINPSTSAYPNLKILKHTNGYFIAQNQEKVEVVSYSSPNTLRSAVSTRSAAAAFRKTFITKAPRGKDNFHSLKTLNGGNMENSFSPNYNGRITETILVSGDGDSQPTSFPRASNVSQVENSYFSYNSEQERHHYMYVTKPNRLEDCVLNSDAAELFGHSPQISTEEITDHVILCLFANENSPLVGLHSFLKPLRSKHMQPESIMPVVIVGEKAYIEKEWNTIRDIPKVYVVMGSPLYWSNLKDAKICSCKMCVILTMPSDTDSSQPCNYHLHDKEAILCTLSIHNYNMTRCKKPLQVIADLHQESNVQFLDFSDKDEPHERIYKSQPFACGEAFSASMFDSVTSSVFHSPGTLHLVESLIHVFGTDSLSQVVQVPIADTKFVNAPFDTFYKAQLANSAICIGISRKLNFFKRYVITSPVPKFPLEEEDIAFVIMA